MNKTKILSMKYPPITSLPAHANLLSVILNEEESLSWFYSNYIQLISFKDLLDPKFRVDFFKPSQWNNCPFINNQNIQRELIDKKWTNFTDFLVDCIDLECYVMFNLNKFFVSVYNDYKKKHARHDPFIFGYDTGKQTFNIADFFNNGKYQYTEIPFSEIEQGYQNFHLTNRRDHLHGINLVKYESPGKSYKFDINIITKSITDYLFSNDTSQRYDITLRKYFDNRVYGISVYKILIDLLQLTIEHKIQTPDLRAFHILYDHKQAMLLRIRFLIENNYIKNDNLIFDSYSTISNNTLKLRNMILKYIIAKKKELLNRATILLNSIMKKEQETLEIMLNEIMIR